jgi:putative SOS response-associated peptidase YedK
MCGRYTLTPAIDELLAALGLADAVTGLTPRYNIAPTQPIPALRLDKAGALTLEFFRWGLVPFWAKDPAIGNRMINARGETVAEKPSFRAAFRDRRCLILADGWYEWKKTAAGKQPTRIQLKSGEAFAFAGIWEQWRPKEESDPTWSEEIRSCAIITSEPCESIRAIHHRMPVVLKRERWDDWLVPGATPEDLLAMVGPYGGDDLVHHPVSTIVNSPANDVEQCVLPLDR